MHLGTIQDRICPLDPLISTVSLCYVRLTQLLTS